MKKRTQRIIVIVLAAALLLSVVVPALSVITRASVTQGDIQGIRNELTGIRAQKKEAQAMLDAIRGDLSKAKEQVELIQGQVVLCEQEINASQAMLDEYDRQIGEKEGETAALERQEAEQLEEFYRQVRWMEETGGVSYLSILFQASSFSEMLDHAMLINDIMEYSERIIQRLQATQRELAQARDELQLSRDAQAQAQEELEQRKEELEQKRREAQELLNQIAASESEYARQAAQIAADEAAVEKALKEAERKYAAQLAALNATSGEWYWPLPGRYGLSSLFGWRTLNGRSDNHTGTDIPAPAGTPIYAAQAGVVTTVGANRYSSYGYYCIISHGNGYATLYAHQRQLPAVSEGQTVSRGQVIGYVGTTGNSTGNHLHFELRVNGVRSNVLKLYPGMTFTYYGTTVSGG